MYKTSQVQVVGDQFQVRLSNGNPYEDWQYQGSSIQGLVAAVVDVVQQEAVRDLVTRLQRAESERLLLLIHMKRYLISRDKDRGSTPLAIRSFYDLVNRMEASLYLARLDWVRRYEDSGGVDVESKWPEAGMGWLLTAPEKAGGGNG